MSRVFTAWVLVISIALLGISQGMTMPDAWADVTTVAAVPDCECLPSDRPCEGEADLGCEDTATCLNRCPVVPAFLLIASWEAPVSLVVRDQVLAHEGLPRPNLSFLPFRPPRSFFS